jgi:hypothetical protein
MGADKNSSRRRLKLQQDELSRSDPQNHTLCTSTFRFPKPHSHWSATGPRNKHYQQSQLLRTHDSGNNSEAGCLPVTRLSHKTEAEDSARRCGHPGRSNRPGGRSDRLLTVNSCIKDRL